MLKKFSTRDLIVIASLAGIGFAMKLLIGPLFKMISRSEERRVGK